MSAAAKPGWAKGVRKEQRISACKPVTVSGQDALGNPFSQNTFTVEIAARGARLRGLPPLVIGTTLLLELGQQVARYRVVWIGGEGTEHEGHVGLECLEGNKSIFGLEPPAVGSFYDEYKRVEAQLRRSERRYQSLFENSLGLICTHDMDGVLASLNPAAARAIGYETSACVGKSLADFLAPSVRRQFPQYLQRVRTNGRDSGYMQVIGRDRLKRVWLYRNLAVYENGSPPYVVGHATDVTEQKENERKLQLTLAKLEKAAAEVKTLQGLLPICAWCKRIRTEDGGWTQLEAYITGHSAASFSHSICPECLPKLKGNGEESSDDN